MAAMHSDVAIVSHPSATESAHSTANPGTPSTLIVKTRGGTIWFLGESRGYEWEYEREVTSADTLQELIPTGPMRIELNTMQAWVPAAPTS